MSEKRQNICVSRGLRLITTEVRAAAQDTENMAAELSIARANKGIGKAAFKAHLHYIQRDGVEQDGSGGELYDRDNNKIDDKDFLKRSEDDRHQFRVIVSPEDGSKLDLKLNTRAFMSQMERDLGTKLDWVAVDHHNTGNPHTHIVIRGKDERGKDLIIARDYITKAMRRLASETVTKQLGPRRDMEIAQAQAREVEQERFTGIDRRLERLARDNEIKVSSANTAYDRFERTLAIRRLGELQRMGLAKPTGKQSWQLKPGWQDKLKDMGKRGDIIRSISASMGKENAPDRLSLFDATAPDQKPVLGKIVSIGAEDELRDTRFIVIEGIDGIHHHVSLGRYEPGNFPGVGAIVKAHPNRLEPKQADRIIAEVAAANDGIYSDSLHAAHDHTASERFRESHKRRLEALRRNGFAERLHDGSWQIPDDFLQKAAQHEMSQDGNAKLDVKSWLPVDQLVERDAETWLDEATERQGIGRFANEVANARKARRAYLMREGFIKDQASELSTAQRHLLNAKERAAAGKAEAMKSRRAYVFVEQGETLQGFYQKPVDLAQGRFAVVGNSKEFTLVPWRPAIERHRGQPLIAKGGTNGITWTPEKSRGIGR